jgi:predicted MFS family arabinose efflux permease
MVSSSAEVAVTAPTSKGWMIPFVVTLIAMFSMQMAILGYAPLLPQIMQEFKFTYTELGLFTGAYGLMSLLLSVPAGMAIHRFNERRVLFWGLVIACIGIACLGMAGGIVTAFLSLALWFTGYRFAFVGVLAALAFACPPEWRGRSFGILGAVSSFGVIIGAPLGGYIGRSFGWRTAMLGFSCIAAATAVIFLASYRRKQVALNKPARDNSKAVDAPPQRSPFRMPRVWGLAVVIGLTGLPSFGITFFVPSAGKLLFHLDGVSVGLLLSSGYLLAVGANLLGGYLMDRFDKWLVLFFLEVLIVPAALLMNLHSLMAFRVCAALIIALSFTATNAGYGTAGDVVKGMQTANVMGIVSLGAGVFGYLGPQLLGILKDVSGTFAAGWCFIAAIAAATAIGAILLRNVRWDTPSSAPNAIS